MTIMDTMPEDGQNTTDQADGKQKGNWRSALSSRSGCLVVVTILVAQAIFAVILISLKTNKPELVPTKAEVAKLTTAMLGHEVHIPRISQIVREPTGKRISIGIDLVLVLGQLPEERLEGSPLPTEEEMLAFEEMVKAMEPRIRDRMNSFLQQIPYDEYGKSNIMQTIRDGVKNDINDALENIEFKNVRPFISRRRVTDVFLPMFVQQRF